ncbi:pheromone processing carboxypeptidase Kex1 [Trichophyton violaceum]|uniref:Carboxypeptidase n=1 Tax=Trichophyton violaceum TaxID=34388 RepID=A0A178FG52_TRIVO|nr:pheromone processing carboxypeptidase Kex1 [Trichophyton violaceum]
MDGALMEIGPYRLQDDHTLIYNNGSWDEFANLLFVDQPVGTGFSYVSTDSYVRELGSMADQFVTFLERWFNVFPEYEKDDIYIAGESYAGQYIPYIADAIVRHNENLSANGTSWNVQGLLIGNGWISPLEQYRSYLPFSYKEGILDRESDGAKDAESQLSKCMFKLKEVGKFGVHVDECERVLELILDTTKVDGKCLNMYDVRLQDTPDACGMNWPPDISLVTSYLRRPDVVKALNINEDKTTGWRECSPGVGRNLRATESVPSVQLLPGLLERGMPIVLFSGDKDLICNHIGTEDLIHNMTWLNATGFELSPGVWAPRHNWEFEGSAAGIYQQARNLTYVKFYNASHMVPFDFPRRSRDMLDRFLGIDITSIGGDPADSRIDGLKGAPTSVGAHPNSTTAEEKEKERIKIAAWEAYYKSGEVALVVVAIAASLWGFFIWRSKRREKGLEYKGIYPNLESFSSASLATFRGKRRGRMDVESAPRSDETELETLYNAEEGSDPRDGEEENFSDGKGGNEKARSHAGMGNSR